MFANKKGERAYFRCTNTASQDPQRNVSDSTTIYCLKQDFATRGCSLYDPFTKSKVSARLNPKKVLEDGDHKVIVTQEKFEVCQSDATDRPNIKNNDTYSASDSDFHMLIYDE